MDEAERVAVVKWLREQSNKGSDIALTKPVGSTARAAYGGGAYAMTAAADAIEAGEHLATLSSAPREDRGKE